MSSNKKKVLDLYLGEVFKKFIAIKDDDYRKSQEIFKSVFDLVKQKIGEQCNYFKKYSSQVMYAGSVYDGIKVSKLDEFDMDIVIRLPISYEDIIIENDQPGFVKLKIGDAFDLLDKQQDWEKCHKVTRDWRDVDKYLQQNKFRQWMHGNVQRALNDLNGQVTVNGVRYLIKYKESGPAFTLNIENDVGDEEFKLDVDLVPVIRFQYPRWLEGYRKVEEDIVKDWLVVPKPNKALQDGTMKNRCWRLSFQDFERDMMKGCQQLKTSIRLVKKLRDSLQMRDIASYYIKTLFLWKIDDTKEKKYWQKPLSVLFRTMVEELYKAIRDKNIPYFWQKGNNLIAGMRPTIQILYAEKLKKVLDCIDANDSEKVVGFLLTTGELQEFKSSEFYEKQLATPVAPQSAPVAPLSTQVSRPDSMVSVASTSEPKIPAQNEDYILKLVKTITEKLDGLSMESKSVPDQVDASGINITGLLHTLNEKMNVLTEKVDDQCKRLMKLEHIFNDKIGVLIDKIEGDGSRISARKLNLREREPETLQVDHHGMRQNCHVGGEMLISFLTDSDAPVMDFPQ